MWIVKIHVSGQISTFIATIYLKGLLIKTGLVANQEMIPKLTFCNSWIHTWIYKINIYLLQI
jgi:hypothetical protein